MSHIGKKPIDIPEGVQVEIKGGCLINIKGKLGELSQSFSSEIKVSVEDKLVNVTRPTDGKTHRELHGLTRALISNMVSGVTEGFKKELTLVGVGFTASSKGSMLLINAGYSHPIYFQKPEGIEFETPNATTIVVKGIDKQSVGQVAAKIRSIRKPEPYKGKGIKYTDEHIRRKAGKTVGVG